MIFIAVRPLAAQVEQDSRRPFGDLGAGPPVPVPETDPSAQPPAKPGPKPDLTPQELEIRSAGAQTKEGDWYHLRGSAEVETTTELLKADEIDYNERTGQVLARGRVRYSSYIRGETIEADSAEYSIPEETGKFYGVKGTAPPAGVLRPGQLATDNPFVFQGEWAERIGNRYVLHNGFITNCRLPNPWWILKAKRFDIAPGERALAYSSWFRLKGIPLLYAPVFYKSLEERPRKSGFLTPNIGTSSRRGFMIGAGYYWAISRSYDATYRGQYFTKRGPAHHIDFRGKPAQRTDFNVVFYGVNDRGLELSDGSRVKQGGYSLSAQLKSEDLPLNFKARADFNYLSSFIFRQNFTESFNEAVVGEVRSAGTVRKEWSYNSLGFSGERSEVFYRQPNGEYAKISIRRLPAFEFLSRDREILRDWPIWVSLESSAALLNRSQPLFETRNYVDRIDFAPRISTALHLGDIHLLPYASIRETHYGSSQQAAVGLSLVGDVVGAGIQRSAREWGAELVLPSLARVFESKNWLGDRVKHVIEPRAGIRDRRGIDNFQNIIRFDGTDILTATREVDYSLTQRLYSKRNGQVREVASWQVMQKYYLDPTFGGALTGITDRRFVIESSTSLTGYAFLDRPRRFSPIVSSMKWNPEGAVSGEWRADYDPVRRRFINSTLTANLRRGLYFVSAGHNHVRSDAKLSPQSNQFIGLLGLGNANGKGWAGGFSAVYDFRAGQMQYATAQVSYNSDCCGISFQFRRIGVVATYGNQYRVSFAIANIGSFGTLRRQERIF